MEGLTYKDINQRVLPILANPGRNYYLCLCLCVVGTLIGGACWAYQFFTGVGAMGLNHPVMWGTDLINFVFWIEIGHAGSMMSALLYLLRAKWRGPIARMAETMTVFAVAVAGLFPFYHLGRGWIAYWIFPYPNQRDLWPNLQSPLVFDNIAVAGYFVISLAFLFIGSVPDIALARDHSTGWRRKFYAVLSLGWVGSHRQWRPFKSAYLFFAFLTMAFVFCVASIVSWDYALTIVPGYHSTIYGPYFLAGAVHSGLAFLLTLLIPMRKMFRLESILTLGVLEKIAKIIIATTLMLFYVYIVEFFMAWYGGEEAEEAAFILRAVGQYGLLFWITVATCMVAPLLLFSKKIRTSAAWLFVLSILINIGMWLERFVIIVGPVANEFLPATWGSYAPSLIEWGVTLGSFSLFFLFFLVAVKLIPPIAMAEMKEDLPAPGEPKRIAHV